MASPNDELIVKIGADFKQLKSELDKAGKTVDDFSDDGKKALARLGTSFKQFDKQAVATGKGVKRLSGDFGGLVGKIGSAKVAIAAASAVAGVYVNRAAESAIETERWAMRLGMSASELSKLSNVAQLGGANLDDLTDTMKEVNIKALEAAEGNEGYRKTFQSLGIDARTFAQLPIEQQFRAFSDAVSTADVDTQQLVRAVDDLASDAGIRMIETLKKGSKGIDEMGNSAAVTAASLSEFDFEQIKKAKAVMDRLSLSIESLAVTLTVNLSEALNTVSGWAEKLNGVIGGEEVTRYAAAQELLTDATNDLAKSKEKLLGLEQKLAGIADNKRNKNLRAGLAEEIAVEQENVKKLEGILARRKTLFEEESKLKKDRQEKEGAPDKKDDGIIDLAPTTVTADPTPDLGMWEQYFEDKREVVAAAKEIEQAQADQWRFDEFTKEKENAERNAMMWKSGLEGRAQVTSKVLGDMSKMMGSKNKEMFKIGKMAAMAQVAIDTPKAAMSAYSSLAGIPIVGPALGAAAAAAAISSGMTQLSNIKSQSFQGGGGGGGGGASAGGMTGAAATAEAPPTQVLETNVTFSGGGDVTQDQFRAFAEGLNEAAEDGMVIGRINV
jgi:hypothetical protein